MAEAGAAPMRPVSAVEAAAGQGLLGDRYRTRTGEWSYDPRLYDDVTLIAVEALALAAAQHGVQLGGGLSRRNVETYGVDLDALVGQRFWVGEVGLIGERPCAPCRYLDRVTGQPAQAALQGHGGLRATVTVGGYLHVGDRIAMEETAARGRLVLERPQDAAAELRGLAAPFPTTRSLVDELLVERRAAAATE